MKSQPTVWLVRWRPDRKNNAVFCTQNTYFRVFFKRSDAEAFYKELRRRIELRWMADTGLDPKEYWDVKSCTHLDLGTPGGYHVQQARLFTTEIRCVGVSDSLIIIPPHETTSP